jgi:hypothetical protein
LRGLQARFVPNGTTLANNRAERDVLSRIETGSAMRLGEINGASSRQAGLPVRGAAQHVAGSRALVALSPAAVRRVQPVNYRQAAFLAHLIAVKAQHPQTRERRRAEPNEALTAYRATAALTNSDYCA